MFGVQIGSCMNARKNNLPRYTRIRLSHLDLKMRFIFEITFVINNLLN
jgi:hypothetical protein